MSLLERLEKLFSPVYWFLKVVAFVHFCSPEYWMPFCWDGTMRLW